MTKKKILAIVIASVIVIAAAVVGVMYVDSEVRAEEMSVDEAQTFVNDAFDKMAEKNPIMKAVADKNFVSVNGLEYGLEKDIILDCSVTTLDIYSVIKPEYDRFLGTDPKKGNSTMFKSRLDFKLEFQDDVLALIENASEITSDCTVSIYNTDDGYVVYAEKNVIDTVFGGVIKIADEVTGKTTYVDADGNEQSILSANVNKGLVQCFELSYDAKKPITAGAIGKLLINLKNDFNRNFIEHDRWKTIFTGLWVTIKLTFFSLLIGIVLGFLIAFIRCTYLKLQKHPWYLKVLNAICQLYLSVTRGTPVVVQIMIIYFVIFMPIGVDKFLAAVICFGLNSGAYVAEIVRGGIMSVDNGQTEAGRSLGFTYMQTMWSIVFPQAFKNVLPALANEFVVLLKETSIAFYIGLGDLMYAGNAIRAATYSPFMPLVAVAIIYLIMVLVLSKLVSLLERRLRNSER